MKEWVPFKLKDITTKIGSGSTPTGGKEAYCQNGITLVRSLNIYDFVFELQNLAFINEAQAKKLNGVTIEKDDILLNITGASVGRCTIIPEYLLPARVNQHVSIIRCNKEIADAKFLLYCINSASYKDALMSIADSGATREALTKDDIEKFQVLLPSLPLQQRIASILFAYDNLIEVNNQRIKLLEETARELYKEWFVRMRFPGYKQAKFVKGVPEGWEVKNVNDIAEVTSSKRIFLSDYVSEGIPFYRGKEISIKSKNEEVTDILHITKTKFAEVKKRFGVPVVGDILITAVGTIGNIYLVTETDGDFYFKDGNLIWLRKFKSKELSFYFYYYSISDVFTNSLNSITIGSSQEALTISSLKKIKLFLPTLDLIDKFYQMTEPIKTQMNILQQQNTQLRQIRDRLLPRLISGKLEVKEIKQHVKP